MTNERLGALLASGKECLACFRPYMGPHPAPDDCDTDYLDCPSCGRYNHEPHTDECLIWLGLQLYDALVELAVTRLADPPKEG